MLAPLISKESEAHLTRATLALHRHLIHIMPFWNWDDHSIENLSFSFWPEGLIFGPEASHCHETLWYAVNLYERAHYERYLISG